MASYRGPVTITLPGGGQATVEADLWSSDGSGLGRWGGTLYGAANWSRALGETVTLHLPDGRDGDVIVTHAELLGDRPVDVSGSGPPPF